jgi:putative Holliday junction resolvase
MSRVLALDYGSARCGVAVTDPTRTLATPLEPVLRPGTRKGLARIAALVAELDADLVLVGLPLSLSGEDSEQTREVREYVQRLRDRLNVPIEVYDERFTTKLARRSGGATAEDSRAAAVLLESWLARNPSAAGGPGPISESAQDPDEPHPDTATD